MMAAGEDSWSGEQGICYGSGKNKTYLFEGDPAEYGFMLPQDDARRETWTPLNDAWRREVEKRLA